MFINGKYNLDGQSSNVEMYDFSKANLNQENRILAITTVASICYNNPKGVGSESLFNRLEAESKGLPSSSFEFVPVLLDPKREPDKMILANLKSNVRKYGEWVIATDESGKPRDFLLTNYRALFYDYEIRSNALIAIGASQDAIDELRTEYLEWYNNPHECKIIKQHFKVFRFKVDLNTRSQMVRHRINWQELSRRYVSGKRVPFEIYTSEKMKSVVIAPDGYYDDSNNQISLGMEDIIEFCIELYEEAIAQGIKPEEARRIIPQGMYTDIWGAFQPRQLENFYKLRLEPKAQVEIREVATAMLELETKGEYSGNSN